MNYFRLFSLMIAFLFVSSVTTGCRRSSDEVWEDTKSASRYMGRGFRTMFGKHGDSRQIHSREEFGYQRAEFVPLEDTEGREALNMQQEIYRQPSQSPGEFGARVPGIEGFTDPTYSAHLRGVFENVYFSYNSEMIQGENNLHILERVARYLKENPNTHIFVEGHCDERGPQAYNLALGARRSNAIRNLLIDYGVNGENVHTVSYGKERPLVLGETEESFRKNRRGQFKVFEG